MSDAQSGKSSDAQSGKSSSEAQGETPSGAFTQADVDRIVNDRLQRERAKYADYEDLKASAAKGRTAEERIADLEKRNAELAQGQLRARIQAQYQILAEDAELFLTGVDEETLTAQAKRLAARADAQKQNNNQVLSEGTNPSTKEDPARSWAKGVFTKAQKG